VRLEGLGQTEKSDDFIGNGNRDLPACSIMPQPTTLPRGPLLTYTEGVSSVVAASVGPAPKFSSFCFVIERILIWALEEYGVPFRFVIF
jgi:hypothetical protein